MGDILLNLLGKDWLYQNYTAVKDIKNNPTHCDFLEDHKNLYE